MAAELIEGISAAIKVGEVAYDAYKEYNSDFPALMVSRDAYYYKKYRKHITIYKNGHGILFVSGSIYFKKKENCKRIFRKLDLSDACKNFKFPTIKNMSKTILDDRFDKNGIWYESQNDFISGIKEFYWSDKNPSKEDPALRANPKHLRWYFSIDQSKIENGKSYDFNYAIALNDMFPITNGKLDPEKMPYGNYAFNSEINIDTKVADMEYIVSFDRGICVELPIECIYFNEKRKQQELPITQENTLFYQKYVAKRKRMRYNNIIAFQWRIKSLETEEDLE